MGRCFGCILFTRILWKYTPSGLAQLWTGPYMHPDMQAYHLDYTTAVASPDIDQLSSSCDKSNEDCQESMLVLHYYQIITELEKHRDLMSEQLQRNKLGKTHNKEAENTLHFMLSCIIAFLFLFGLLWAF